MNHVVDSLSIGNAYHMYYLIFYDNSKGKFYIHTMQFGLSVYGNHIKGGFSTSSQFKEQLNNNIITFALYRIIIEKDDLGTDIKLHAIEDEINTFGIYTNTNIVDIFEYNMDDIFSDNTTIIINGRKDIDNELALNVTRKTTTTLINTNACNHMGSGLYDLYSPLFSLKLNC